ncbi:ABC transporter ATP-binding protein [Pseudooceanicola sp. C21-150M6]|uniref:ABC transporter ATP-binding protein n=1 Tax=Pseudooceanicola sp. C21-150M6 TaxID=3434355 RepID=UPI003D7F4C36
MTGPGAHSPSADPGLCLQADSLAVTLRSPERSFRLEIEGLRLVAGEATGLTGGSGTGKTLLLELLGLLRRPDRGAQYQARTAEGVIDLAAAWDSRAARSDLTALRGMLFGFVPQAGGLLPFLTVLENVTLGQKITGREDAEHAAALMERLGIAPLAALYPGSLSIGQRQRVAIARALAHRPPFVIADEPTAALDPDTAAEAMSLLVGAARDDGAALLVSSHDLGLLDRFPLRRLHLSVPVVTPEAVVSRLSELQPDAA